MRVLYVTGYRPFELNIFKPNDQKILIIKEALKRKLTVLIDEGLEWVLISGQTGVELWTAEVIMELKAEYDIQLGVVPPFENMETRWSEQEQILYKEIVASADFFRPLYKGDYKGAFQFQARDNWIIEKTDGCLMLVDEEYPGSTSYFLEKSKQAMYEKDYLLLEITPFDLEDVVREMELTRHEP
ncbi:DUF1273 domain-containing protein [Aquibacillus sp. 3ASR75-11]|uniref:DUF1273 domain-containing protein n=1 Tax=Terrihalobacillus insolitus TaxID=2950438 RepID=A0A9X4AME1_9BACI|nr:DUF1273 domain-containing protein [Terrihalobacillus insolitus]MDC3424749.1 DUF1273 domain-containing protein [Terrihalobacillus insolitus]